MTSAKRGLKMTRERITIDGMGCSHCVEAVRSSLEGMGIHVHDVEIGTADISYDRSRIGSEQIDAAIAEAGYKATAHNEVEDLAS
jgi:copper chaperone CopZ